MLLFDLLKILFSSPIQFFLALIVLFVPLLISITVHEWAHGMVAYAFGDNTPKKQGRLSFNPFAHLDPVGTLMLFIIGIGWAKPVEVNPDNINGRLKKIKLSLVALAGPMSNFIFGTLFIILAYFLVKFYTLNPILSLIVVLLGLVIRINFMLGIFNLIPLPPLDGANILAGFLPDRLGQIYFKLAPYSLPILFLLIMTGGIRFISGLAQGMQDFLIKFIGSLMA